MPDNSSLISRVDPPAVAVETAFLTSGLPTELRLDAAQRMAAAIRSQGANPAFTGVVAGRPVIGLDQDEISLLAQQEVKLSTRDLAAALARRQHGGTTVAATVFLAQRAGLTVAATGGIGGVQVRSFPGGLDISADLNELGRTRVILVCSGAKAIADLRATLERLETLGVVVVGLGTDQLPAFWSSESGLQLALRADSTAEVAAIWQSAQRIGVPGSLLVCVPPPADVALTREETERAVSQALSDLDMAGVSGPAVTPFLLARIAEHTEGRSVTANLGLLENNAAVAAAIVKALEVAAEG